MSISVIVNGANGKMGQITSQAIDQDENFVLAAGLGRNDNLIEAIKSHKANIVIDFTDAASVYDNTLSIIESGAHPVIGTSGLKAEQVKSLQEKAKEKKLGGIIAPNFSIGAVLMMKYAEDAAKYFNHVEIIEHHHNNKKDSPSGTAVKTAEMISKHVKPKKDGKDTIEVIPGARGANYKDIPIHSVRIPGVVAHQAVIYGGHEETLQIQHNSISRESFIPGIIMACKSVVNLESLIYGLENLLEEK